MSKHCKERFGIALSFADFFIAVGLLAIGLYRFIQKPSLDPREIFLSFYYIAFGALLMIFMFFKEKVYPCFRLLSYKLGKAAFFLFLATITCDYTQIAEFTICILIVIGLIMNLVYFCVYRDKQTFSNIQAPSANHKKNNSGAKPNNEKIPETTSIVVKNIEKVPVDVKKEAASTILQRRL